MRILSALLLSIVSSVMYGQGLPGPVSMIFQGDRPIPAAVLAAMQREAETTVFPSQIRLAWQAGQPSQYQEVVHRLTVIRFRGECRPDAALPLKLRKLDSETLGQTQTSNGEILPVADIQCDAVRQFLDRDLRAAPAPEREELLGRALGRVVAHELYHILLRTRSHGHSGLARSVLRPDELLARRQTFAPAEEQRLAEVAAVSIGADEGGR